MTYAAINGDITPSIIFPALSLFNNLFQPILIIPQGITQIVVGIVSWKRIESVLLAEEGSEMSDKTIDPSAPALQATNLECKWESVASEPSSSEKDKSAQESAKQSSTKVIPTTQDKVPLAQVKENTSFVIKDIDFTIEKGKKVALVGPVGSGKSSLLSSLIGEMPTVSGSFTINGSVAYCNQQPWILTDSIQGNIVFNQELNQKRLEKVLEVCCLNTDLELFPAGVMTEIGEKGVNLSGNIPQQLF